MAEIKKKATRAAYGEFLVREGANNDYGCRPFWFHKDKGICKSFS